MDKNKCPGFSIGRTPVQKPSDGDACHTPLYGSLPVGPAFDLALAAWSIKNKKVFPSPQGRNESFEMRIIGEETDLGWEKICCLKIRGDGQFGRVTLRPFPLNPHHIGYMLKALINVLWPEKPDTRKGYSGPGRRSQKKNRSECVFHGTTRPLPG